MGKSSNARKNNFWGIPFNEFRRSRGETPAETKDPRGSESSAGGKKQDQTNHNPGQKAYTAEQIIVDVKYSKGNDIFWACLDAIWFFAFIVLGVINFARGSWLFLALNVICLLSVVYRRTR